MAFSNLRVFINRLAAFNTAKGNAPIEEFPADLNPSRIAMDHAIQRDRNRAVEEMADADDIDRSDRMRRNRLIRTASHIAADRLALRNTLIFVERRWREGGTPDQVLDEATDYRRQEYRRMTNDASYMSDVTQALSGVNQPTSAGMEEQLVDGLPPLKKVPAPSST